MNDEVLSEDQAKRDQLQILTIAEGFFHSCILSALIRLNIFNLIGVGERSADSLAKELKCSPETLARLLNAAVVLKLIEPGDDASQYRLSSVSRAALLGASGETYLGNWVLNLDYFRGALSRLDEAVLSSRPVVSSESFLGGEADRTREYIMAMHNYASLRGKELAEFLDTTGRTTLLDVGCGAGTYAFHLGKRNPGLRLFLLDLPEVLEIAKEVRQRYQLVNEVNYVPLDVSKQPIPGSYSMILVSNILHMLGEEANRRLLRSLYNALEAGGCLVIQAQYLNDDRRGGRWPVLLDLIQLCTTAVGRNHTVGETKEWLVETGFKDIEHRRMTLLNTNSYLCAFRR